MALSLLTVGVLPNHKFNHTMLTPMIQLPKPLKIFCAAAAICSAGLLSVQAQELVDDGGFEDSVDMPPPQPSAFSPAWNVFDPSGFTGVGNEAFLATSGTNYAFLGATPNFGSLNQNLTTIVGTPYLLSFFVANDTDPAPGTTSSNSLEVFLSGVSVFSVTNAPDFPYMNVLVPFIGQGPGTVLEFIFRHDDGFFRLDDVSVRGPNAVPELGSTAWLAIPAFAGLLLMQSLLARRRQGCPV